jgi:hypothetical protein
VPGSSSWPFGLTAKVAPAVTQTHESHALPSGKQRSMPTPCLQSHPLVSFGSHTEGEAPPLPPPEAELDAPEPPPPLALAAP